MQVTITAVIDTDYSNAPIINHSLIKYVRVTYSIGERAKQLVKVICTLTYWAKILQWLHTQEAV